MCSRQRMKRDNAHTLYLGYVRTSGENALKKKKKHFDTARRDRARLLTPTSLTVHRFAFVAFHSSVTARKSNTQNVTAYGLNKTERREDSAPLANHTRTRLALVLISLHCGAHIKSVCTIFLQATAKAYSQMEMCIHKKKKRLQSTWAQFFCSWSAVIIDEKSCRCKRKKNLAFYNGAVKEVYIHLCHTHINISKYNTARTKSRLLGPKQRLV